MSVVVFATTYALILPAITKETTTFCGKEEHAHDEGCYVENLVCTLTEEEVVHEHTETCYETTTTLICELEESAGHTHTDACKQVDEVLVCEIAEDENHTHGAECYTTQESYICNQEESAGHTHTDGCYAEQMACVCTKETDIAAHEHTDSCYEKTFSCEAEEHTHDDICYSDKTADLETASDWEKTLPKKLSGVWADDLIAVAESQLGYTESTQNFIVNNEGKRQGYTRYGEWYGDNYGHWCAMFISFCMNYAEIPEEEIPYEASCQRWIEELSKPKYELYKENREYIPEKGDLIFFNTDHASDSDHVGIVVEYKEGTETQAAQIKTIEGNSSNQVKYNTYYTDDTSIMGFGILPEEPQPEEEEPEQGEPEQEEVQPEEGEPEAGEPEQDDAEPEAGAPEEGEPETGEPEQEEQQPEGEIPEQEEELEEPGGIYGTAPLSLAEDVDPNIGDKYHAPDYLYYQFSSHKLDDSAVCTFMLVPTSLYNSSWTPNVKNWSAKANANYVVAYCSDSQTYSGSDGVNYTTYELSDSRFKSKEQRDTLAGIIGHAYPFLTADEMKAQLKAAYNAGEINVNVTDCIETEFIAAAQWAIWDTTNAAGTFSKASGASFGNYSKIWNPLSNVGHTNSSTINSHVKAIRDWLVKQRMPEPLAVADYSYTVTPTADGIYDLQITIELNRGVLDRETAKTQLKVGKKLSDVKVLTTGTVEFTLEMDGLTEAEIAQAYVHLVLNGQDIKTYFYDAANHQDLIGGVWANFNSDLSFDVGVETIDVSVTKQWTTDVGAKSVQVQLLANGTARGDKISLSDSNDWTYTWESLPKYDLNNKEIKYTVLEDAVSGYHSSIQQIEGTATKVNVWQETDTFENGGKYLLESRSGILTEHKHNNKDSFTWATVDMSDADGTPNASIWTASNIGDNGTSARLKNLSTSHYLRYTDSVFKPNSSSDNSKMNYKNSYLSYKSNNSTYYFGSLNTDHYGTRTTDTSKAVVFTMYKLTEVELPPSDINYLITNTKVESSVDVQVNKVWEGRRDGKYPEKVQVRLLQDGNVYSELVELNTQNNWSYSWSNLPYKIGDKNIQYSIEEVQVAGYTTTVAQSETANGFQFTVTNTWEPEYGAVILQKVDADDVTELLSGAKFELYLEDELVRTLEVGDNGELTIENLEIGAIYSLIETEAPDGYNRLKDTISFTVVKGEERNTVTISEGTEWVQTEEGEIPVLRVKNQEAFALPDTGGFGDNGVRILGVLLFLSAVCILNKRKREGV